MPRAATTSDVFNAIAEPRRRQIIDLLVRRRAMTVGSIVVALGLAQPAVSKHLGVLREVGIVTAVSLGQERIYHLRPRELKPVYDWIKTYEQFWAHQLDRIKARAERRAGEHSAQSRHPSPHTKDHPHDH